MEVLPDDFVFMRVHAVPRYNPDPVHSRPSNNLNDTLPVSRHFRGCFDVLLILIRKVGTAGRERGGGSAGGGRGAPRPTRSGTCTRACTQVNYSRGW